MNSPDTRSRLSGLIAQLALAIAIAGTALAGFAWWQTRQIEDELGTYNEGLLGTFQSTSSDMQLLSDAIRSLEGALAERDERVARLEDDLQTLAAQLAAVGRRVDGLQGGQLDARDSWLRQQAEYYLVLANSELNLRDDVSRAIEALELADDVLLEIGDPGLSDVRGAVAAELQSLRAVPQPDLQGVALELGSLMARVDELPLREAAPGNYEVEPEADEEDQPGLGRLLDRTRGAVTSIIRIEREDEPAELVLTESERRLARRQLVLELQLARTAAIERREADYRASLVAADALLGGDFDRQARSVSAARELLGDLMTVQLAPPLPDIGDSLILLRTSTGAR